jgi:2-oxoglutarate dehydrogenase E1 component
MALSLRKYNLTLVSRGSSAAPAAGSSDLHKKRLASLFENLFTAIAEK